MTYDRDDTGEIVGVRMTRAEWRKLPAGDRNRPGRGEARLVAVYLRSQVTAFVQVEICCAHGVNEKTVCPRCEGWLSVVIFPNAQSYADRRRETHGDYHRIASIYFNGSAPSELKVHDEDPSYAQVVAMAARDFEAMLAEGFSPALSTSQPWMRVPMRRADPADPETIGLLGSQVIQQRTTFAPREEPKEGVSP